MPDAIKTFVIATSIIIVLIASFAIINFYSNNQAAILDETMGESSIYIETTRHAILFPGECLQVRWEINGINAVYILKRNEQTGTTGADSTIYCIWSENPHLRVDFPDGSTEIFTLDIQHLYRSPLIAFSLLLTIVVLCTFAYFITGIPSVLVILTIIFFSPLLSINASTELDFYSHLYWIQTTIASDNFNNLPAHFVFHYATILLGNISPSISVMRAAFFVVLAAQVGTVLGFYALFTYLDPSSKENKRLQLIYGAIALALPWAGPISYFIIGNSLTRTSAFLYPNTYHSPTMIVLRPFAVWLFVTLISVPPKWSKRVIGYLIVIAVLLILASFSKPNYTLVIVPAYFCLSGLQFLRDRRITRNSIVVSATLLITASIVLGWQFRTVFVPNSANLLLEESSQIVVQWFGLYTLWGISYQTALLSWLLSLLFPIAVYILYIKKTWRDDMLSLAWIALLGAIAMLVLFIEIPRTNHGNFVWGSQITNLILFGASASFLIRQGTDRLDWRVWFCISLFMLHVLSYTYMLIDTFTR